MSASLYAKGSRINYSNSGSLIAAGDVVVLATGATGLISVSISAIPATTGTGEVSIGGPDERIWTFVKDTGEAFTIGQILYWDGTGLTGTNTTTNTRAGRAAAAANSAATTALLILNQA